MRILWTLGVVGLSWVAGCGSPPPSAPPAAGARDASAVAGFPRRVVDASGHVIVLQAPPRRIVSQTLGTDEMLFAMVDRARVAGVSTLARDPAYSSIAAEVSATSLPAITTSEQVIALRPDLVFVATFSRAELVEVLRASGAPVYRFGNFDRLSDVRANVLRLGEAVGSEAAAEKMVAAMDRRLAAIKARRAHAQSSPPRVLSYTGGFTAGASTTFDDIVRNSIAVNVAAEQGLKGFPKISAEQVLRWQPDFLVAGVGPGEGPALLRRLRDDPAIAATRAMKAGRVILIDNRALLSVSHHVVDAVDALAAALEADARKANGAR